MSEYNGASTGAISGAAQGASTGMMIGGPWGAAIGAGVGLVAGYYSGKANDKQMANQMAWAKYNADMQYKTDMSNIKMQYALSAVNAVATMAAASANAATIDASVNYNTAMIYGTTRYNQSLMSIDLSRTWEDMDLSLEQLETFKLREQGGIIADQAASGTVIDEGSNMAVIVSQESQRALDANIIMFNADRQAADIQNQMSRSNWEGQVAIQQTIYDGNLQIWNTMAQAESQAGAMMGAAKLQAFGDTYTAKQAKWAAGVGIVQDKANYNAQNRQAMTSGLFTAASTGAQAYYANKPYTATPKASSSAPSYISAPGSQNYIRPTTGNYAGPGTSIAGGLN